MSEFRDRIKDFRRVPAASLKPSPRNWRTHPAAQREALEAMLGRVGIADAAIARELPDGSLELIDGHLRADVLTGDVPVLVLDVDQEEADQLLATLDPLAGMAGTDGEKLNALLSGFAGGAGLDEMLDALREKADEAIPEPVFQSDPESDPDEVPEVREAASARRGDLIVLGAHRLLCGDSTNADDVARLMDGETPFQMVTDPPYGVEYDPEWRLDAGLNKEWQTRAEGTVSNDGQSDWTKTYELFGGDVAYVWHAGKYAGSVAENLSAAAFEIRAQIIWVKPSLVISRGHYHWRHEPCWYAVRKGKTAKWCGDRKQSTAWDIPNMHRTQGNVDDGKTVHGTQKPIECMARPIRNHGEKADSIYDPFLGSGTTVIAAEQLGRRCFGMEIDPIYVDVIVRRWQTFTGKKAEGWRGNT